MAMRKIKLTYYAYYRDGGVQRTVSLHTRDKKLAQKLHDDLMRTVSAVRAIKLLKDKNNEMLNEIKIVDAEPKLAPTRAKRLKLCDMMEVASKYRELSERHSQALNRLIKFSGLKYANEITPKVALDFLTKNFGESKSKTYNNNKTYLNTIFKLCLVEANIESSPFASLLNRLSNDVEHRRPLTEGEYQSLLQIAPPAWQTAIIISWHTGMPQEACFKLSSEMLEDRAGVTWIKYLRGKTKRFKRHTEIPAHPELLTHLSTLPTGETPYTDRVKKLNRKEKQLGFGQLLQELKITSTADGIADFHSLRNSFITRCDEAGIPRHAIRSAVGHVNDNTTDTYSHDQTTPLAILKLK